MRPFLLITFLLAGAVGHGQTLPSFFKQAFQNKGLDKKYVVSGYLKPSLFEADFNGDGSKDIAALVVEKLSGKKGVLLMHGKTGAHFVFGAGRAVEETDDFAWADAWRVYKEKVAYETQFDPGSGDILGAKEMRLARPGVLIEAHEDGAAWAGGLVYWDGKRYVWIHQGE
jgi:hypothetical protein